MRQNSVFLTEVLNTKVDMCGILEILWMNFKPEIIGC